MNWKLAVAVPVLVGTIFVATGWIHPSIGAYHLLCAALVFRHRHLIRPRLRWERSTARWAIGTSLLVVFFLGCSLRVVEPALYKEVFIRTFFPAGANPALFALFAFYTLLIHVPLEEVFWRAVVTDPETATVPSALIGNAVFFGLLHAVPLGSLLGLPGLLLSLPAAAAGALWAFVTMRSRSLWPALVSHWGADAVILGGMWFFFVR